MLYVYTLDMPFMESPWVMRVNSAVKPLMVAFVFILKTEKHSLI